MKLIALLILTCTLLISCSNVDDSVIDTNAADTVEADNSTEATTEQVKDDLPAFDFGGVDFNIWTTEREWLSNDIDTLETNGDILNDAVFERNAIVEERFNVVINSSLTLNREEIDPKNSILAGDSDYHVLMQTDRTALTYAQEGLIYNLDDLSYIDVDKPYWSQSINKEISIQGKLYFSYGDFNLSSYDYTHVLTFNKKLINDFNLENLYDLVREGKWTYDKFNTMMQISTNDLNGDGIMDDNDQFGYVSQPKHVLPCMWISAGEFSIKKNSNDEPEFNLATDEKFASVIEKIFNITWDTGSWYQDKGADNADLTLQNMFENNQALFNDSTFFNISKLRNMEADFGIIPYPKYDEIQNEYYSRVEGGRASIVPITNTEIEMISVIMEAMSATSYDLVIPAYYEIALKGKVSRDAESEDMLDIIKNGRIYDLGDTYWCDQLRDGIFQAMFRDNDRDFVSKMEAAKPKLDEAINKAIEAFASIA